MKKIIILLMLISLMAFTGCNNNTTAAQELPSSTQAVESSKGIEVMGEAVADAEREITIDFPALITDIPVKQGQVVKNGDVLLKLDYSDYNNTILQKAKEIEFATATLNTLIKDTTAQAKEINSLKEKKAQKEKLLNNNEIPEIKTLQSDEKKYNQEYEKATKDYAQQKQLFDIGSVSKESLAQYEKAMTDKQKAMEDANYSIEKIQLEYKTSINDLNADIEKNTATLTADSKAQIKTLDAQNVKIELAKLELEKLQNKLNKTYLKDNSILCELQEATVKEILCKQGSILSEQTVVIKLIDNASLIIRADIPEEFVSKVKIGAIAEITPYADKTKLLTGKVVSIANNAVKENGETIIKADIVLDEPNDLIKSGFSVDVKILQ